MNFDFEQYLDQLKFTSNPFLTGVAEYERDNLHEYFILRHNFKKVLGVPGIRIKPVVYFAARGNGKSATALMVGYLLRESVSFRQCLVIKFDSKAFEKILTQVNGNVSHITPYHFYHSIFELVMKELKDENWAKRYPEITYDRFNFHPGQDLQEVASLLNKAGLQAIYVLVDGVDELHLTINDPSKAAELIVPLLSSQSYLDTTNVQFKFFLPAEIKENLDVYGMRWERFTVIEGHQEWSEKELLEMLETRLRYFSNKRVNHINEFSDTPDIDERMCREARGSPRNLIRLGDYLLDEHFQYGLTEKISEENLDHAINKLYIDLGIEKNYKSVEKDEQLKLIIQQQEIANKVVVIGNDVFVGDQRLDPPLANLEMKLLKALYLRRGQTCDYNYLLEQVYPDEKWENTRGIEALVGRARSLRRKLKEPIPQHYIKTVSGIGYRLQNYGEVDD